MSDLDLAVKANAGRRETKNETKKSKRTKKTKRK